MLQLQSKRIKNTITILKTWTSNTFTIYIYMYIYIYIHPEESCYFCQIWPFNRIVLNIFTGKDSKKEDNWTPTTLSLMNWKNVGLNWEIVFLVKETQHKKNKTILGDKYLKPYFFTSVTSWWKTGSLAMSSCKSCDWNPIFAGETYWNLHSDQRFFKEFSFLVLLNQK